MHKKYTKKHGKLYGPYLYENKRVGGKVVTTYVGSPKMKTSKLILISFLIGLLLGAIFMAAYFRIFTRTGRSFIEISEIHQSGEFLAGQLKLNLMEGEFIPKDSRVSVSYGGELKEFSLSDLVDSESSIGDFFLEGNNLSGSGDGYGVSFREEIFPSINFNFRLVEDLEETIDEPTENNSELTTEDISEETSAEEISEIPVEQIIEEEIAVEETPAEESAEIPDSEAGISGNVILSGNEIEEGELSGSVSKEFPFIYETGSQRIEIVSVDKGSINDLRISYSDGLAIITTEYSEREVPHATDKEAPLILNLESMGLIARNGSLTIALISNGNELGTSVYDIASGDLQSNYTNSSVDLITNFTNATFPEMNLSNVSLGIKGNFDQLEVERNQSLRLDLEDYFYGAERYSLSDVENISLIVNNSDLLIVPEKDFVGIRESRIIAYGSNESVEQNFSINVFESSVNVTGNVSVITKNYRIVLNRPVRWQKKIVVEGNLSSLDLELPKEAENISIKTGGEIAEAEQKAEQETEAISQDKTALITGNVIMEGGGEGLIQRLLKILGMTGKVIEEELIISEEINSITQTAENQVVDINTGNNSELLLEYETPAPTSIEEEISGGKRVVISAASELNYTDILSFTEIPEIYSVGEENKIRVYWRENQSFIENTALDLDGNELLDYVEWITPHLSNQTFDIILISKAEHLDANRSFIEDVFDLVNAKDGNYSLIGDGEYLRVTFERNLSLGRDITVYGQTGGVLEVYRENGVEVLASISVKEEGDKVYPSLLEGESLGVFDLKALGEVYVDYVVDPYTEGNVPNVSFTGATPASGSNQGANFIVVNVSSQDESPHYSMVDFDRDLLLWLRMDDTNSTGDPTDLSSYGNNGSKVGGDIINSSFGKFGNGSWSNGVGGRIVTNWYMNQIPNNGSYSVSYWINRYDVTNNYQATVMKQSFSEGFGHLISNNNNDMIIFQAGWGSTYTASNLFAGEDGIWVHVVQTFNGSRIDVYKNGAFFGGAAGKYLNVGYGQFSIGAQVIGTYPLNGSMDEVMVFNRSLSAQEIRALYNATIPGNQYSNNFTNLALGSHTFSAYAVDTSGNKNLTEQRSVTIAIPDTTFPDVNFSFPTPASGSSQAGTSIYVNVSSNDANQHYSVVDFDRDLVGWWRFDDVNASGDPTDLSSWGNNGGKKGNAVINSSGKFGNGSWFDGNADFVNLGNSTNLNFNNATNFSISFWVNEAISTERVRYLVHKRNNGGYDFFTYANYAYMDIYNSSGGSCSAVKYVPIGTNTWNHVVGVYNGTGLTMYLNGVLWITKSCAGFGFVSNNQDLAIGAPASGATTLDSFNGSMDEVLIFNRTLSLQEIKALYNSTTPGNQYSNNFTSLATGSHTFSAYAVDTSGNKNQTEERSVTISQASIDAVPEISFVAPSFASGATTGNSSYEWNVSINDANIKEIKYLWNNTNYTLYDESLVLMFNFDNLSSLGESGSVVKDLSRYGNNGTMTGGTFRAGKYGKSARMNYLDFDDDISIPDSVSTTWDSTKAYTYSMWVYFEAVESQNGDAKNIILSKGGLGDGFELYTNAMAGLSFGNQNDGEIASLEGLLQRGIWTHVAFRYNNGQITFYRNGVSDGPYTRSLTSSTEPLKIFEGTTQVNLNGSMDNFMIWNRSLSNDEIKQVYYSNLHKYGATNWSLYLNESDLASKTYYYQAYVNDSEGNSNQTELRSVVVSLPVAPDTIFPDVNFSFPTPASGSSQAGTSIYVNVSSNDTNQHYSLVDFDRSLVVWWRFDDTNSTGDPTDLSSWGNNGSKVGGVVINSSSGKFGNASWFDGINDYINLGKPSVLNISKTDVTLSFWMKSSSLAAGKRIYSKRDFDNARGIEIYLSDSANGHLQAYYGNGSNYVAGDIINVNVADGNWHHIIVNINQSADKIFSYKDGIYINSPLSLTAASGGNPTANVNAYLGAYYYGGAAGYFNGSLDEFLIFNRSLSLQEIQALYNSSVNQYFNNFTNLAEGSHTFTSYAVDTSGNKNQTEERSVTIAIPDTTFPDVNFTFPTPASETTQTDNSIYVNVTSNDANQHYSLVDFDRDLLLWMRMDDTNSTGHPIDLSSYGNNGSLVGNALINSSLGKFGNGSWFDGAGDRINLLNSNSLNTSGNTLTLSAWYYLANTPPVESYILSKNGYSQFKISVVGTRAYFTVTNSTGTAKDASTAPGSVSLNTWHHIVGTYNGTGMTVYHNGAVASSIAHSGGIQASSANLSIGSSSLNTWYWNGSLDEVMIFNRSLSAQEVKALYNATIPGNQYSNNFTNLALGSHNFTSYAVDTSGNKNQTEERSVTITNPDLISPNLTIASPLNQTYGVDSISFNVSSNENLSSCIMSLDNFATNYSMTLNASLTGAGYLNNSMLGGAYTAKFACNDSAGNWNSTESRSFGIEIGSNVSICRNLTLPNTAYSLIGNLNYNPSLSSACIYMAADNISLDGKGYNLTTSVLGSGNGINVGRYSNMSIVNVSFSPANSLEYGIYSAVRSSSVLVQDCRFYSAQNYDVYLLNSTNWALRNNSFAYTSSTNLYLVGILDFVIEGNRFQRADVNNLFVSGSTANLPSRNLSIINNYFQNYEITAGYAMTLSGGSGAFPERNISEVYIYNNLINNSFGFSLTGNLNGLNLNSSLTVGTNIIGGSYLGGNYWTNITVGYSTSCSDISPNDGICDGGYSVGAYTDYLPLTTYADNVYPSLTVFYPQNTTYNTAIRSINFSASDANLDSCWYNLQPYEVINENITGSCNENFSGFTSNVGSNTWFVAVNDSAGHINSTYITFFYDPIFPRISFTGATPSDGSRLASNEFVVNVSVTEDYIGSVWVELNSVNYSLSCSGNILYYCNKSFTGLADGSYNLRAGVNDSIGNTNVTETRSIIIDSTKPLISILSPLNQTYEVSSISFNVSSNENLSACVLSLNNFATNYTMGLNASLTGAGHLNSSMLDGAHTAYFACNDSFGNVNMTGSRSFSISTDFSAPSINFSGNVPANDSYQIDNNFSVNITGGDVNFASGWVELNNVNYSMSCSGADPYYCNKSFTDLADGSYSYRAYVNDSRGNGNVTQLRKVTIIHSCLDGCTEGDDCTLTSNCSLYNGLCSGSICNFDSLKLRANMYSLYDSAGNGNNLTLNLSTITFLNSGSSVIFSGKNGSRGGNAGVVNITVANLFNTTNARFVGLGGSSTGVGEVAGNGGNLVLNYRGLIGNFTVSTRPALSAGFDNSGVRGVQNGSLIYNKDLTCIRSGGVTTLFRDSDVDGDGRIAPSDLTSIALRYNNRTGDLTFAEAYDLSCKGKINVVDITRVGYEWNSR